MAQRWPGVFILFTRSRRRAALSADASERADATACAESGPDGSGAATAR
jgi:hypothetical protein